MRVIKLIVENFKRISAISITPEDNVMLIAGKNGAGKSATLDAIATAIGGVRNTPRDPVKHGTKKASIVLETETFTIFWSHGKKPKLEITMKDGSVVPSPRKFLDQFYSELTIDPNTFIRKKPKDQSEILRLLVGLDFTEQCKIRSAKYAERTDTGRDLKRVQGAIDTLPGYGPDTPDKEVSVSELSDGLEDKRANNASNRNKRKDLDALRAKAREKTEAIKKLESELATITLEGKDLSAEVNLLVDDDIDEAKKQLQNIEKINESVRVKIETEKLAKEINALVDISHNLTIDIEKIDEDKAEQIKNAKYPIDGLVVNDEGVELNGVLFGQASQAEQLRASIAIGLALNPGFNIILSRDGSLLDKGNLKLLNEIAEELDAQIWLEVVAEEKGDHSVFIEDGVEG